MRLNPTNSLYVEGQCYKCDSATSNEDCLAKGSIQTCPSGDYVRISKCLFVLIKFCQQISGNIGSILINLYNHDIL